MQQPDSFKCRRSIGVVSTSGFLWFIASIDEPVKHTFWHASHNVRHGFVLQEHFQISTVSLDGLQKPSKQQVNYSVTMGVYESHTDTFKIYHLYFLRRLKHVNIFV